MLLHANSKLSNNRRLQLSNQLVLLVFLVMRYNLVIDFLCFFCRLEE